MRLPGLVGYGERMAEHFVNYQIRCREEREAERERTKAGPVTRYIPYAGVYKVVSEGGALIGYAERIDNIWIPTEPVALV